MDDASPPNPPFSPDETIVLLERVRSGDNEALNALLVRLLPRLRRWAHGRLPESARHMLDTGDIVQTVAMKAIRQLSHLDVREHGSLGWYLRQAVRNEIASHWRRAGRTPLQTTVSVSLAAPDTSPLEQLLRGERLAQLDAALERLDATDRDAIHGRFELGYDYDELATYLGKASAATTRVAVHRAVKRLLKELPPLTAVEGAGPAPVGSPPRHV